MIPTSTRILLTSVGAPGGPALVKLFLIAGDFNIVIADAESDATSHLAFKDIPFYVLPRCDDLRYPGALKDICLRENISCVIPLSNFEAKAMAELKESFRFYGVRLLVNKPEAFLNVDNKAKLYEIFDKDNCVKLPKYAVVPADSHLPSEVENLGYPDSPVVIKPVSSSGSRGVRILDERANTLDHFVSTPPDSLIDSLDAIRHYFKDAAQSTALNPVYYLICEYLPGVEVTVDALFFENVDFEPLILIRQRSKLHGGLSVAGKFVEIADVEMQVKEIQKRLELTGAVGFQFKQDKVGIYRLIEVNLRLQGGTSSCLAAGVNIPHLLVKDALGLKISSQEVRAFSGGEFVRYWADIII